MQDITRIYHNVDDGFVSKIFFANTGVLTSLIFAKDAAGTRPASARPISLTDR